jgi:bifunctional aspartokinase / homoserine dehydrogenase 1
MTRNRQLRVMKFGGTSVGDASCIRRVAEIVRNAAHDSDLVVVVSAMGGVTNKLIDAATQSEAGDRSSVEAIFTALRNRHDTAVNSLVHAPEQRRAVLRKMQDCYEEGERLCRGTDLRRELSLRDRDSISSLGERLSAPLVAASLTECGLRSEAIEATEVIVTDSCHGAADPCMEATRARCRERLRGLLQRGIVPVVTGFIGATPEGVLTTLGRGGSDYSATILAAALDADEVVIWTDVDGLMTSDPRVVEGACTIPEISYREAADLAHFGAKVLHPKTILALKQCGIPLWIRNTFAPQRPGTRITPVGPATDGGVKGLTSIRDVTLVTLSGPSIAGAPDVLTRALAMTDAVRSDVLLISHSSAQNGVCLVLPAAIAEHTVEALRCEFAQDLAHKTTETITVDPTAAIVTMVGTNMRSSGIAGRACGALALSQVDIVTMSEGSSDCSISVVIAAEDTTIALVALHREFHLDPESWPALPAGSPAVETAASYCQSEQPLANGD